MSKAIIDEQSLTDIADAIRTKNGSADTYTPSEMATAITDLPSGLPTFEYYEITADTAMTNGTETDAWFDSLISEHSTNPPYVYALLFYVGNTPVYRQFMGSSKHSNQSPVSTPNVTGQPYRWQNNAFYTTIVGSSYDTNVNIGDKYILVLVRAELFV